MPRIAAFLYVAAFLPSSSVAGPVVHLGAARAYPTFQDDGWDYREEGKSFSAGIGLPIRPGALFIPVIDITDFSGGRVDLQTVDGDEPPPLETNESESTRLTVVRAVLKFSRPVRSVERLSLYGIGGFGWFRVRLGDLVEQREERSTLIWEGSTQDGFVYSYGGGAEIDLGRRAAISVEFRHNVALTDENLERFYPARSYESMRHFAFRLALWLYL